MKATTTASAPQTKLARFSKRGRPRMADNRYQEQYEKARADREEFKAKRERLEYERRKGTLLDKKEVERDAFNQGRIFRDAIFNIADRVAGELAAETDQDVIHGTLMREFRQALEGLSR